MVGGWSIEKVGAWRVVGESRIMYPRRWKGFTKESEGTMPMDEHERCIEHVHGSSRVSAGALGTLQQSPLQQQEHAACPFKSSPTESQAACPAGSPMATHHAKIRKKDRICFASFFIILQ
jgi:hypothetical protein